MISVLFLIEQYLPNQDRYLPIMRRQSDLESQNPSYGFESSMNYLIH